MVPRLPKASLVTLLVAACAVAPPLHMRDIVDPRKPSGSSSALNTLWIGTRDGKPELGDMRVQEGTYKGVNGKSVAGYQLFTHPSSHMHLCLELDRPMADGTTDIRISYYPGDENVVVTLIKGEGCFGGTGNKELPHEEATSFGNAVASRIIY